MKIEFKKINASSHELKIIRDDLRSESTVLDTKTYMLHDICHFYVEKSLNTPDGFWGMLSRGYQINQLFGKTNQLTEKLRVIEYIVGGTQSVFSKYMNETEFWSYIQAINYDLSDKNFIENVIPRINEFMEKWNYLPIGQTVTLDY